MDRKELIFCFSQLGKILNRIEKDEEYTGYELGINQQEFDDFKESTQRVRQYNPWFTEENVKLALTGIASWLNPETLENWLADYPFASKPKKVAVIMAGNIPLVGFHDFISVVLSGNIAVCKLSSDDTFLWKSLFKLLVDLEPKLVNHFTVVEGKLGDINAVIATGSDNSSRYFDYYFGKYPHIIRKNRTSVAVLTGNETPEELKELGKDIFSFFGMGCRNVSQLFVPKNFELDRFFEAMFDFGDVINHHKYANNFDYNRTVSLLNGEKLLENGFLLLKFSDQLFSPLSIINCHRYEDEKELTAFLKANENKIQVVIGEKYHPFGKSQEPKIDDYADGVNTMQFLATL